MKWFIKVLRHYADFSGRARRKEYWMFALLNAVFSVAWIVLAILVFAATGTDDGMLALVPNIASMQYMLVMLLPGMAVAVRRLHDLDKSGWWLLIGLIPIIGGIWLFVLSVTEGRSGDNRYGPDPKTSAETFDRQAGLKSAGIVLTLACVGIFLQDIFGLIQTQPELIKYSLGGVFFLSKLGWLALLGAGILLWSGKHDGKPQGRERTTIYLVATATTLFILLNMFRLVSARNIPIPVEYLLADYLPQYLCDLSMLLFFVLLLFAAQNRDMIRVTATVAIVFRGLYMLWHLYRLTGYLMNYDYGLPGNPTAGMVRILNRPVEVWTAILVPIAFIMLIRALTSVYTRPATRVTGGQQGGVSPLSRQPLRQSPPVSSSATGSVGSTSEQKADNGERGGKIEFDNIMIPFTTPNNGFYDEQLEESKNIALQQMMSSGSEGEQYLMNFILKDVSITDGYFLLRYYGDQAHSEWTKKCRIIDAFANSKDEWVINKLNEFVLCKGKENQFAVYFQPRVVETLGKLKQYNSLEKLAESGQVVPAVLLAKDILRLHRLGTADNPENIRDKKGYTPLQTAVYKADNELVKQLLNKGADIDQICSRGENLGKTALYMAVEMKNLEIVKLLLSYKADPKLPDLYGAFPLQKAAAMGLFDILKALMENGADKNQKTLTGKTPLMWAEQNGHRNVAQYLRDF